MRKSNCLKSFYLFVSLTVFTEVASKSVKGSRRTNVFVDSLYVAKDPVEVIAKDPLPPPPLPPLLPPPVAGKKCGGKKVVTVSPAPTSTARPSKAYQSKAPSGLVKLPPTTTVLPPLKTKAPTVPTLSPQPTRTARPSKAKLPKLSSDDECKEPTRAPSVISTQQDPCNNVLNGLGDTSGPSIGFVIDILLVIDIGQETMRNRLTTFLTNLLRMNLTAACNGSRRLQTASITNIDVQDVQDDNVATATCPTPPSGNCYGYNAYLKLYYTDGDTSSFADTLKSIICQGLTGLNNVIQTFDPCPFIVVTPNNNTNATGGGSQTSDGSNQTTVIGNNGGNGAVGLGSQETNVSNGISVPGVVSVAAAGLLLILVLLLAVHRKKGDEYVVKHKYLEDDVDDTYLRDMDSDNQSRSSGKTSWAASLFDTSPPRRHHVVGESNSIISSWTGNTKPDLGENRPNTLYSSSSLDELHHDVHICSSATCKICEEIRQSGSGIQFIPTTLPGFGNINPSGSREYPSTNTVHL